VNIPGFYDGVVEPQPWERDELAKLGENEAAYARFLGVESFHAPPGFSPFEAIRFLPTLEFNGIGGGYQGEGRRRSSPAPRLRRSAAVSCPTSGPPPSRSS